MKDSMFEDIMTELPALISESDLHVSQLCFLLLTSICQTNPRSMTRVHRAILPQLLSLICSPLMQGVALSALLDFFQALVVTNTNGVRFRDLLQVRFTLLTRLTFIIICLRVQMLTQPVYSAQAGMGNLAVHKHVRLSCICFMCCTYLCSFQAFLSIAQSIAALTIQCKQEAVAVVNQFIADIKVTF